MMIDLDQCIQSDRIFQSNHNHNHHNHNNNNHHHHNNHHPSQHQNGISSAGSLPSQPPVHHHPAHPHHLPSHHHHHHHLSSPPPPAPPPSHHHSLPLQQHQPQLHHAQLLSGHFASSRSPIHHLNHSHHQHHHSNQYQTTQLSNQSDTLKPPLNHHDESTFLANQHHSNNCYSNNNINQYESCSILPNTKTKIKRNRSSSKDHQNRNGSLTNIQPTTNNSILPQTRDDSRIKTNSLVVANKSSLMKISTNHSHNNNSEKNISLNGVSHSGLQGSKSTTPIMTTADTLRRKKKSHLSRDELARVCQLGEVTFESYNNSTYMIAIRSKGDRKSLIGYRCDWNNCGYMNARVERMFGHIRSQHPDAPTVKKLTTTANCTSTTTTVTTSTSSILSSRHRSSSSLSTASSSSSSTSCLQSPHTKDSRMQSQASSTSATTTTCSITPSSCNSPLLNALNGITTEMINNKQTTNKQSLLRTDDNENDVILFNEQEPDKKECHLLELLNENQDNAVAADIISINDNNKNDNSAIMHQTTISNQLETQTFAGTSNQCMDGSFHPKCNKNNNDNDNEQLIDHLEAIAHPCPNEPLSSNVDLNTVDSNNNECAHETVDSSLAINEHNHNRHHSVSESNNSSTNENTAPHLPDNNNDQQVKVSTLSPDELDSLFIDVNNKSMPMTKRNENFILDEMKKNDAVQPINTNNNNNCNGKLTGSTHIINSISAPVSESENSHSHNEYRQFNGYRYNSNSNTNNNNNNNNNNSNTSNVGANDFVIETKSENSQSAASNTNDSSLLYENETGFDLDASLNDASNSSNSGFGGLNSANKKRKANNSKNYIGKQNLFQEFKSDDVAKIRDSENKYIIALQKDMKIVGYRCDWPECEFLTCRKYVMVNHINGKHTNQRPYSCDMCNFTFVKRYFLKAHMHKVHKRGMNEDKKDDDELIKREHDSDDHFDGNLYDDTTPILKKKFKLHSGYYQTDKCDPDGFNGKQSLINNVGAQPNIYKQFKPVYDDYSTDPLQMNGTTNPYADNDSYNGNYPTNKCFPANTSQHFDQTNGSFDIGNSISYDNGYPNPNGPNMYGPMSQQTIDSNNSSVTPINTMTSLLTPPLNNTQMVNGNYRRNSSNNQCYNNTLSDTYAFNDKTITGTHPQTYTGLMSNTGNNQFNMDEFLSPPSSISSSGSGSYSNCYMPGTDSMQPVRVTTNNSRTSNSLANSSSFYLHTPSPSPSSLSHSPASTNSVPIFSQTNANTESNYISGTSKNITNAGQYPTNFANTFNTDTNYMDNWDQMKNNSYSNGGYGTAKFGLMANDTKTMESIYPIVTDPVTNQSSVINHPPQQQYLNYDGGFNNDSFSGTAPTLQHPPMSYGGDFDSYSQTGPQLMSGSSDIYSTNMINRNGFTNHSAAAAIGSQDCWNSSTTW